MASPKVSTRSAGFTLIEVVIVMGLIIFVAGFGLIVSIGSYRGSSFRAERDTLVATLEKARSEAINNMCYGASCSGGRPHGVHIDTAAHAYIVFQGESYATRDDAYDETVPQRYGGLSTVSPSFTDVVFSRLAATTTPNPAGIYTLSIVDAAGKDSSVITVNPEGQIAWTH